MSRASNATQDLHELYVSHHGWLCGWLRGRVGDVHDTADLAQDVFARLLTRTPLPALIQPRAYLSTIARGLVVDHWRRRTLEQAWRDTLAALPEATEPSPESRLMFLQALMEIDRVLDQLRPPERHAFLLAQLDGLSCPQIAQQLGLSLATVERYIAKALRCCYAAHYG